MRNKILPIIGAFAGVLMFSFSNTTRAASNTVDYYLTTPDNFKGTMVNLDVAGVRPVEFKSPVPELAFFHMRTWDKTKNQPGGHIILVAPASESTDIMHRYGDDSRHYATRMHGVLILSPGGPKREGPPEGGDDKGPKHRPGTQIWMIDYEGRCAAIIEAHKEELQKLHDFGPDNEPPPRKP